ncbi:hypothetical protein OH828_07275 [Streptomyces anulatus]
MNTPLRRASPERVDEAGQLRGRATYRGRILHTVNTSNTQSS